jgi:hypothetical protein
LISEAQERLFNPVALRDWLSRGEGAVYIGIKVGSGPSSRGWVSSLSVTFLLAWDCRYELAIGGKRGPRAKCHERVGRTWYVTLLSFGRVPVLIREEYEVRDMASLEIFVDLRCLVTRLPSPDFNRRD